ncbi:GntR family transcriptional regulator [Amycolatopsis thailandensis]|uniref:GntR family transcriptional regulator n=1 Tax=Amycolatopsis thailandensis TaxID=589330 RepID=UPI0037B0B451
MVDRRSGVPAFRQIAADLRQKISAGSFAPGDQLPSERELTETYQASRPTVRDAIKVLRAEGLVTAEHGRGVFVRPPAKIQRLARNRLSRAARAQNRGAFLGDAHAGGFTASTSVKVRFEEADERVADLLGIEVGTEVTVRDRVMRADGLVVMLAVSRLPRDLTRGTAIEEVNTGPGGAYARLEEAGHTIEDFAEIVGTRAPTPEEASLMQLPESVSLLKITRIAFGVNDTRLEINDMLLDGERFELVYTWPAD